MKRIQDAINECNRTQTMFTEFKRQQKITFILVACSYIGAIVGAICAFKKYL